MFAAMGAWRRGQMARLRKGGHKVRAVVVDFVHTTSTDSDGHPRISSYPVVEWTTSSGGLVRRSTDFDGPFPPDIGDEVDALVDPASGAVHLDTQWSNRVNGIFIVGGLITAVVGLVLEAGSMISML